jgi:hypothetical protein
MRLQREQFLDLETEPWWLLERELDPALEERRRSLGQCWGWTDLQWYAEVRNLEQLYLFLEQTLPDLLRDLDEAADVDRRKKWLDELIEKKQPAAGHETQEAAAPKEPAPPAAAKVGAAGAAPARKVSAFARAKPAEQAEPEAGETEISPAATGTVEPAKKSIFKNKAASAAGPVAQSEPTPGVEPVSVLPTLEEFKETLSGLAGDPQIPISEAEVEKALEDPNFLGKVAAAEAELEAELASAEAEG